MDTAVLEKMQKDILEKLAALDPTKFPSEEKIKEMVGQSVKAYMDAQPGPRKMVFGQDGGKALYGSKFSRHNMSIADVEFLHDLMVGSQGRSLAGTTGVHPGPSEELRNAFQSISAAIYMPEDQVRAHDRQAIENQYPRVLKTRAEVDAALKAMDTAETGFGLQLVGAQYVSDLWDAGRMASRVFGLIPTFEMTAPTAYLPIQQAMPELLYVGESTANNSSNYTTVKTGSNRVSVSAAKFVIHQMWSGEMEEDSIIPFVPFLRLELQNALAHYSDALVLNGDTTNADTLNINSDDANPADTKYYLAFDGLRHVGLVDNTNNRSDAAAAPTVSQLRSALKRMVDKTNMFYWGAPNDPNDLIHVMDFETYLALTDVAGGEVVTVDKFGPRATILTGELAAIWGHPIIVSSALKLTAADGKVDNADDGTKGQVVTFNRRGFVAGWRRRIKIETERLPATDQNRIVASLRMGFGRYGATVGAIEAADVIYDLTV